MSHRLIRLSALLVFLLPTLCVRTASSQQPLPNAAPAAANAQPPAVAAAAANQPAVLETNPAVLAAQEWPRSRPADALRAVLVLMDLDRPDLAKPILVELQARPLTPDDRAKLVAEFGSYRMLQLARNADLAPTGAEFSEACMAAAGAAATDPGRLTQWIAQLFDPAADIRLNARVELVAAGPVGAKAVLEALARETEPGHRPALMDAAAHMHPLVDRPLLAMLETTDSQLRDDVSRLLAALRVPQAAPLLAGNSSAAEMELKHSLDEYQQGAPPFASNESNQVELWQWDDATKTLSSAVYPAAAARTLWMARLARELAKRQPENRSYLRRAVVLNLEAAALNAAAGQAVAPATTNVRLPGADLALLNQVLADALATNYGHAAAAVCDELGRRGDPRVLTTGDGKPSPLAAALTHADRRVRFAALRAIMYLDPKSAFPGSSHVPEALEYFARSGGRRAALVAMPTATAATDVAGKLAVAGFEGEATNLGADVARMAGRMPDLELVLVDMDILAPGVRQVLYELRTASPSGQVPVALLAADGRLEAAHRLADEHQQMIAVPRPHSAEAVAKIASLALEKAAPDAINANERAMEAVAAVTWTAELLERPRNFYALRRQSPAIEAALYQPAATSAAIAALARFGTPESQRALIRFASQNVLPIESRRQAAEAFAQSVKSRGLLLTSEQILDQYNIYNASVGADGDTQQVLGALLDTIESRRATPAGTTSQP